jgi:hypothetical protein
VSLRESGQCPAAKKLLLSVEEGATKYSEDLKANCMDREFDLYQPMNDFGPASKTGKAP